jgi:hypothetical protein
MLFISTGIFDDKLRPQMLSVVPVEDDNTLQYNTNMLNVNQDGLTGNKVNLSYFWSKLFDKHGH